MATRSIGIDIREAHNGGAGKSRYCEELTKALLHRANEGVEFVLFGSRFNPHFPNNECIKQVVLKPGPLWHWRLKLYLKKHPVDLFLAPNSYIYPAIAPRTQKIALVIHDLVAFLYPEHHHWFPTFVERIALKRALHRSSTIITVSENTWEDLLKLYPKTKSKEHLVLHPGVGAEFKPTKATNIDPPKRFLLAVGTLQPRKNFPIIFQAFEKVAKEDKGLHLCIIGGKGWKTSQIFNQVPDQLKERVHFLGYVGQEELLQWYSAAQVFLFPSLYEGFGIPPLEAMACDCPVITSNVSSLPEVVADAALTVDPRNPGELAKAIQAMLRPENQEEYKKRGRKRATLFSWEKSADELLKSNSL